MKEEDLIKKLENVELPDIKLQDHQRRLRMALLDAGYPERQRETHIIKGVKGKMIKGLVSRQPVWKTVTVAVAAVALVIGLSLAMPFTSDSACAQAEEITRNSAEVKAALGGGEVQVVSIDIGDIPETGKVIAKGEAGSLLAEVDLIANKVTKMSTFEVDDQIAIEIAQADPQVKGLLDSGATIGEVSMMYICGVMGNVATGETEDISETLVMVDINGTEDSYVAYIDLAEGKVERLLKAVSMPGEPPSGTETYSIPDKEA
jgi:hypothetical protein